MTSTAIPFPTESPVLEYVDGPARGPQHRHQHHEHRFDLDDAFALDEDDVPATTFDFSSEFLQELQLRPTLEAEGGDGEMEESNQASFDSTDASVSTLDIDRVMGSYNAPPPTRPQPSSSSYSLNSEAQPCTPPDSSPASPAHINSQFAKVTSSPPLTSSTHTIHDVEEHPYPNVIIDASKVLASHVPNISSAPSQHDVGSHGSWRSSTSDNATNGAEAISGVPDAMQSVSTTPSIASRHVHSSSVSSSTAPKATRHSGPSVLEKVVSKTRPPHLPPKQKAEDEKHSKEWEEMMQRSREADEKRRVALETRRLARELSVEASTSLWQRAILPDWKKAVKDPELRRLWWDGVPLKLRSVVWERAVGNGLALSKDSYTSSLARAKNLHTTRFSSETLVQVEADISRTLPDLHIFHHITGPLYGDLRDLLCAWVVSRADEGQGYVEGVARIGGMLLLNLTGPAQAFVVLRNLLETGCLRAFYGGPGARDDVEAYYRIFDTLLADGMPKVYFNFKQHQISPAAYLPDWLLPLFLDHLPLEACSRIWDVLLLEGDAFLFRAALAMLACLESRLFFPDRGELLAVLKGENSAARHVALRTGLQSPARDGVPIGPRYAIYGINEETLWQRVMETEEWFKESTWRRLIQRELPDL